MVESVGECNPCESKRCDKCKNFIKQTETAYSFHADSVFKFNVNHDVNCESLNVVYIINEILCTE